jgi:urease accessory protein
MAAEMQGHAPKGQAASGHAANGHAPAPGWSARLALDLERMQRRTVVADRRHFGPLCIQKPFQAEDGSCHIYVLHPPGGLAGGDDVELRVRVGADAAALVTMPASTKFYRTAGAASRLVNRLSVAAGGALEWLPPETILFGGAHAILRTEIRLDATAAFIGWEALVLGRPSSGDRFAVGVFEQRLELFVDDRPVLLERFAAGAGDTALAAPWGFDGEANTSTLIAYPADEGVLDAVREALAKAASPRDACRAGASLVDSVLVVRGLAPKTAAIRRRLEAAWRALAPLLLGRPALSPRIWST